MDVSIQRRRDLLVGELSMKKLPLRHDSRLCSGFIYNQLGDDWNVHRVVNECAMMHWLFSYTNYQYKCREAYSYFSTVFTSGRSLHEFVKQYVQPHIKAQIILAHGGVPSTWPWLWNEHQNHVPPDPAQYEIPLNEISREVLLYDVPLLDTPISSDCAEHISSEPTPINTNLHGE